MKTKRVELGDVFYVFTNWGICKGLIIRKVENEFGIQYKLNIDIDKDNLNKKYGFFFTENQLFYSPIDALTFEANKWDIKKIKE